MGGVSEAGPGGGSSTHRIRSQSDSGEARTIARAAAWVGRKEAAKVSTRLRLEHLMISTRSCT